MFNLKKMFLKLQITLLIITLTSLVSSNDINYTGYCPPQCVCFKYREAPNLEAKNIWVSCEGRPSYSNGYKTLPAKLPDDTFAIDLTFNNITHFKLTDTIPTLRSLTLTTNNLKEIDENSFDNLYNLEALYLSYNNISELKSLVFNKLTKLTLLDLSYNNIENLPKEIFSSNNQLNTLILHNNPLSNLRSEWFDSLINLEKLDISKNKLYSIRPETFHSLRKLKYLDLSSNLFTHVPNEGLRPLGSNLLTLKLNDNRFKYLNEESFKQMSNLVELEICSNELLTIIEKRTFSDLINLQNLTIADNHLLSYIHPSAFNKINGNNHFTLKTLDLKRNHLTNLSSEMLPFCKLDVLDLRKNHWNCDCSLLWVKECQNILGDPRCWTPNSLIHEPLTAVSKDDLVCNNNNNNNDNNIKNTNGQSSPVTSDQDATSHTRDVKTVKVLILLMAATLLLVLGMSIAVVLRRSDLMKPNTRRGNGSIYYVKAQSTSGFSNDIPTGSLI